MIDPQAITDYARSDNELEEFALFTVAVAGKTASHIARAVDAFLDCEAGGATPFAKVRRMVRDRVLTAHIRAAGLGKWGRLSACYRALAVSGIDLRTCSVDALEAFPGIGPKTSRFFIMHSRPGQRFAVLDTHILAYMRDQGLDTPRSTPTGARYAVIERAFIDHAEAIGRGGDLAAFDLAIWNAQSTRSGLRGSSV